MRPTLSSLGATSAGGTSEGERFSGLPPLASRSTTSATTTSPTPPSSGRSVWNGSSRASRRFTDLVRPISCCATSIAAHSKSMTLPTITDGRRARWAGSDRRSADRVGLIHGYLERSARAGHGRFRARLPSRTPSPSGLRACRRGILWGYLPLRSGFTLKDSREPTPRADAGCPRSLVCPAAR